MKNRDRASIAFNMHRSTLLDQAEQIADDCYQAALNGYALVIKWVPYETHPMLTLFLEGQDFEVKDEGLSECKKNRGMTISGWVQHWTMWEWIEPKITIEHPEDEFSQ